jgi:ATP-binding cassette subfamily D (ALD) long-chain fatty acid import protein
LEKKMVDLVSLSQIMRTSAEIQYIPHPSGSRTLLVPHMGRISKVRIDPIPPETYASHLKLFPPLKAGEKLGVNKKFWKMLAAILRIAFPR